MADFSNVTPLAFRADLENLVGSDDIDTIVVLTQAQYDALDPADPDTLYIIEEV